MLEGSISFQEMQHMLQKRGAFANLLNFAAGLIDEFFQTIECLGYQLSVLVMIIVGFLTHLILEDQPKGCYFPPLDTPYHSKYGTRRYSTWLSSVRSD